MQVQIPTEVFVCYDGHDKLRDFCFVFLTGKGEGGGYSKLIDEYGKDGKSISMYLLCTEESLSVDYVLEENHAPLISAKFRPPAQRCSAHCCLFLLQCILGSAM